MLNKGADNAMAVSEILAKIQQEKDGSGNAGDQNDNNELDSHAADPDTRNETPNEPSPIGGEVAPRTDPTMD